MNELVGGDSMECSMPVCETFKISCLMGRHHMKGGSECPLTDQLYCLEQWSNITSLCGRPISRLHQFGAKVLPGIFLGYALHAGVNLERRHYVRRH